MWPSVRILVAVTNIQMRTLKAEKGKCSCEQHLHMGYFSYSLEMESVDYGVIIRKLCREGAQWKARSGTPANFPAAELKPDAKFWFQFVVKKMMSTTHISEVTKERAALVYAIVKGKKINVGSVIQTSIQHAIRGTTTIGLPHPHLITELCHYAGVPMETDLEKLKSLSAIIVHRPQGDHRSRRPVVPELGGPSSSSQPQAIAPPPPSTVRTTSDRLHSLERTVADLTHQTAALTHRTDTYMTYMLDFTAVLSRRFPGPPDDPFPPRPIWPPRDDDDGAP